MRLRVERGGRGAGERVGVALSGGIDSIGVAFACRKFRPDAELHTFTAGVDRTIRKFAPQRWCRSVSARSIIRCT